MEMEMQRMRFRMVSETLVKPSHSFYRLTIGLELTIRTKCQ